MSNQQETMGKVIVLLSELTGLEQQTILTAGYWLYQNQKLVKLRCSKISISSLSEIPKALEKIFKGSPVEINFEELCSHLEVKLVALMDKLAVKIEEWFGSEIATKFKEEVALKIVELKKLDLTKAKAASIPNREKLNELKERLAKKHGQSQQRRLHNRVINVDLEAVASKSEHLEIDNGRLVISNKEAKPQWSWLS